MRSPRLVAATLLLVPFAGCGSTSDTASPAVGGAALEQSATMGTTTQQQASGSQAALGDATSGTSTPATVDQYGPTGGTNAIGDASADTAAGGEAGGITGRTSAGMSSSTISTGQDASASSGAAHSNSAKLK